MIGQRALPKIMVVIMDGCGRIRVSFREFQVIREIHGDTKRFGNWEIIWLRSCSGDVNDDGLGHAITPFLGGELQGGLGSSGPVILIGNTRTSSTCLHVDMQRGSKMQLHFPEESVHGRTSCECIHTVRQR